MAAAAEWTILQVHEAICEKLGIPLAWQTLLQGTEKLSPEVLLGSLVTEDLAPLQLTLVVAEVEPGALLAAIRLKEVDRTLQLLKWPQLPCLNYVDRYGWTPLHRALFHELQTVAMAIVCRPDYQLINTRCPVLVWTTLQMAARQNFLAVCRAIVARADFTELLTTNLRGETASDLAERFGHHEVAEFLRAAEHRARARCWPILGG